MLLTVVVMVLELEVVVGVDGGDDVDGDVCGVVELIVVGL